MRKTLFAGLTVLNPDEAVTSDNGAFIGRDRDLIDHFLELGAKTHRHTGLNGLSRPVSKMGASAITSGGTIAAGQTFTLAYTLEDEAGGETLVSPSVTFSTPSPMGAPTDLLTGQAIYEEGGDLPTDTYYYAFSFVDGSGGETPIGPAVAVERQPGFEEAKILLTGFAAPVLAAGAAGWRLYRAVGGGDFGYLSSGTTNSFTDDGSVAANCDLPPLEEGTNSTNGDASFEIVVPSADIFVSSASSINVYMSNGADFVGDVFLEQFPLSSAGKKRLYRSVALLPGQPPDVSTSIGTAHLIDPDTELLDWHWKRPVAEFSDLPETAEVGDVRVVTDEGRVYVFESPGGWTLLGTSADEVLEEEGMGVIVIPVAEKGIARPTRFKQYTWFCKEEPTNLGNFDIWIEEGP